MSIIIPKKFYKKSLGQHLLQDENVLHKIIEAANLTSEDQILEIGAGSGILSERIIPLVKKIIAVEFDKSFKPFLHNLAILNPNFQPVWADILKLDLKAVLEEPPPKWRVMGNIPYGITSPLISKLLNLGSLWFSDALLMLQKEVGERLTASSGRPYGSFSIWVQFYTEVEYLFTVPARAFFPPPKVDSCIIRLKFKTKPSYKIKDQGYFNFCQKLFNQRRKKITNSLKAVLPKSTKEQREELLRKAGMDSNQRIEEIPAEKLAKLYADLSKM
jgi:16S rRNA (adenine1518-N6/adenine1519-N6)-dimethyltransferase